MLTVTDSSTNDKMTTLRRAKRELEISAESTEHDIYLNDLILEASQTFETFCNRRFARETVREKLGGTERTILVLERTPVVSVTGVTFGGSTISSTEYAIEDSKAGTLYRESFWRNSELFSHNVETFPTNERSLNWQIDYVAGYVMPSTSNSTAAPTRTLPYDLERACLDIVKSNFMSRGRDPKVKTQKIEEASETLFDDAGSGIPKSAETILMKYQRYV